MPISNADAALRRGLVEAANVFAISARNKASSQSIPKNIAGAIEVGEVQVGGSTYSITVSVNLGKAPAAAAYEFGSGLFGKQRQKYIIKSKEGKILHFYMPEALNIESPRLKPAPGTGEVFLPQVMHPGVKARPYMQPALQESAQKMRDLIGRRFRVEVIHKSIREAWDIGRR